MGWREAFRSMTTEQKRRFVILADCREREGDPPDAISVVVLQHDTEAHEVFIRQARGPERRMIRSDKWVSSALSSLYMSLASSFGPFEAGFDAVSLVFLAERRGIDLDPIVDAVLMGEERQFLERLTLGR